MWAFLLAFGWLTMRGDLNVLVLHGFKTVIIQRIFLIHVVVAIVIRFVRLDNFLVDHLLLDQLLVRKLLIQLILRQCRYRRPTLVQIRLLV